MGLCHSPFPTPALKGPGGQRRSWDVPVDSVFDWRVAGGHWSISWWSDRVSN
jgi:hypothetical protein